MLTISIQRPRSFILSIALISMMLPVVSLPAQMITQGQVDRKRERYREKLLKLTAADFQRTAMIEDDDLTPLATISTENSFRTSGGLFDVQGADIFLRAHIEKKSGEATYQVYLTSFYQQTEYRDYMLVNFEDESGVGTAKVNQLSSRILSCDEYSNVLGCKRVEDNVFDVSEDQLRAIAARPTDKMWRLKYRARAGKDWEEQIAPAEVAGLLMAVDAYRASKHLN